MKSKAEKFKLGKKTVSNLTNHSLLNVKGGAASWTITATLVSVLEQTCKCSFPPKCTSDNAIV